MTNIPDDIMAQMIAQINIGNQMIADGDNSTTAHIKAAEKACSGEQMIFDDNLSNCANLRQLAKNWQGTRADFIMKAVAKGVNKGTAATQFQKGRKS